MSIDEIAHLDFQPGDSYEIPLRERAMVAFRSATARQEVALIGLAAEKIADALGELSAELVTVKVTNIKDGDGEIHFEIDGLKMRVNVVYPTNIENSVSLAVKMRGGGWSAVRDLPDLGRILADGQVEGA